MSDRPDNAASLEWIEERIERVLTRPRAFAGSGETWTASVLHLCQVRAFLRGQDPFETVRWNALVEASGCAQGNSAVFPPITIALCAESDGMLDKVREWARGLP